MCRSKAEGGRRCPYHSTKEYRDKYNAYRRAKYAEQKQRGKLVSSEYGLSPEQKAFFNKSVVKNADGSLKTLYHGTNASFDIFDTERTGNGVNEWGSGFYFTPDKGTAEGYGTVLKECYLNITKPIIVDGKENMSLNTVTLPAVQVKEIIKHHPDIYVQPKDAEAKDLYNPLGDYSESYWDKDEHSEEELDHMIDNMVDQYFSGEGNYALVENFFTSSHATQFRKSVHDVTGYDGVIVDFKEDGQHYIAWFPEQIKATNNTTPTVTDNINL